LYGRETGVDESSPARTASFNAALNETPRSRIVAFNFASTSASSVTVVRIEAS
jgi:hypothetical protein